MNSYGLSWVYFTHWTFFSSPCCFQVSAKRKLQFEDLDTNRGIKMLL